jgi:hypothetical protein
MHKEARLINNEMLTKPSLSLYQQAVRSAGALVLRRAQPCASSSSGKFSLCK